MFTFMITELRFLDIEKLSNTHFSLNIAVVMIKPMWKKWGRKQLGHTGQITILKEDGCAFCEPRQIWKR
jgi:hypothetical protein